MKSELWCFRMKRVTADLYERIIVDNDPDLGDMLDICFNVETLHATSLPTIKPPPMAIIP